MARKVDRWVYNPLNKLSRRIKNMKGKFYFWGFVVIFAALTQLLSYYANPTNWSALQAIVTKPSVLTYNVLIFFGIVFLLIWLLKLVFKEDKHEKETIKKEQEARDQKLIQAFKQAVKEIVESAIKAKT
jgi:Na+/phosphate symporter